MLRARRSIRVTINTSPLRRKSRTVRNSSRPCVVVPDRFSARMTSRRAQLPLKATEQPIDTGTAAGKCFLDMLGVFAEFETNLRKERQLEGIAKAKAVGIY